MKICHAKSLMSFSRSDRVFWQTINFTFTRLSRVKQHSHILKNVGMILEGDHIDILTSDVNI
jgi:hypothetical protein